MAGRWLAVLGIGLSLMSGSMIATWLTDAVTGFKIAIGIAGMVLSLIAFIAAASVGPPYDEFVKSTSDSSQRERE